MDTAEKVDVRPAAYVTSNDLVSSQHQDELLIIRDVLKLCFFRVGDIANEEILANAHRVGITDQAIYDAVGVFVGRRGRTVRYYAETAAFFPPDVRNEYDMLSFSHFDTARNFRPYWRDVLEVAKTNPGMTAEMLALYAAKMADIFDVRPPAYENFSFDENSDVRPPACEDTTSDYGGDVDYGALTEQIKKELPERGQVTAAQLVGRILNALAGVRRLMSEYRVSAELAREVADHIEALNELIPRVANDIRDKSGGK